MKSLAIAALVSISLLSVGCTASEYGGISAPPSATRTPSPQGQVHFVLSDLIDNNGLSEPQRQFLLTLYKSAPRHRVTHPYAAKTIVAVAMLDNQGHIISQFANRRDASIVKLKDLMNPQMHAGLGRLRATYYTGKGPYHQLIQPPPTDTYSYANLSLPCSSADVMMPTGSGDGPYVYLGGYTTAGLGSSEVEVGEQGNVHYSVTGALEINWQPYIRVPGSPPQSYPGNSGTKYGLKLYEELGTGAAGEWACPPNHNPISLTQDFSFNYYPYGTQDQLAICFVNSSTPGGSNLIFFAVCPASVNSSYQQWEGWNFFGGSTECTTCYLIQTTAIAQPEDQKNNGAYFGPVSWTDTSPNYSTCINYPTWGAVTCGDTPPYPKNSVIAVFDQMLSPPGAETVLINNRYDNWRY